MGSILETSRLVLREAVADDAAFLLELMNEPAYHANIGDRGVRTVEDARSYLAAKYSTSYRTLGYGLYVVELKREAVVIGICGFVKRETLEHADVGFAFLTRFCGQGYGYESASAVLGYGQAKLGFAKVYGVTSRTNEASIRLLEKLGFRFNRETAMPGYAEASLLFARTFGT